MLTTKIQLPQVMPSGEIVGLNVTAEAYMRDYADSYHEWIDGVVIKMASVSLQHKKLEGYLYELLRAYFALHPVGQVIAAPFVMRLEAVSSRREPDLQVILHSNEGTLTDTYMDGAADICIEIVSPGTVSSDYGDKLREYEAGGVREYWIIDSHRREVRFHRLGANQTYQLIMPIEGHYTTPLLPKLRVEVAALWSDTLPNVLDVVALVKAMLEA